VTKRLAIEMGVVSLPSDFFRETSLHDPMRTMSDGEDDDNRWIRFSVANVDDEKVRKVCERLEESEARFGWPVGSGAT
jgi:hypothetical protein